MEVILLERVGRLGQMGEIVRVKDGYARNFLLAKGKALRATKENRSKYEGMRKELEARNLEQRGEAEKVATSLDGKHFIVLRQAADTGQLFGSVSARDLVTLLAGEGFQISRSQIALDAPIKNIGQHKVPVALHPEVEVAVLINVARNAEEAERLERGENVTVRRIGDEDEAEQARAAAEAAFDTEAQEEDEVQAEDEAAEATEGGDAN